MYAYYGEVMEINKIEQELLKLITKAKDKNEVPIAALIVKKDKIISKSYNKVNKSSNILDHAEILVIKKASKKLHNWRLDDCDLYVTLEPCSMCKEVIRKSRIKNERCQQLKTAYAPSNYKRILYLSDYFIGSE